MITEKFVEPENIRLSNFQKKVLKVIMDNSETPKLAGEAIINSDSPVNMRKAAILLNKYGLITFNEEDLEASLTDVGEKYIQDYNIADDTSLVDDDNSEPKEPEALTASFDLMKSIQNDIQLNEKLKLFKN